jgi:hypothetical protein
MTQPAATLTRPDGTTATLSPALVWESDDTAWANILNLGYDPTIGADEPAGLPAYVAAVARAAEAFGAEASYPWSDSPPLKNAVH